MELHMGISLSNRPQGGPDRWDIGRSQPLGTGHREGGDAVPQADHPARACAAAWQSEIPDVAAPRVEGRAAGPEEGGEGRRFRAAVEAAINRARLDREGVS